MLTADTLMQKKILQKQVKQIVQTCSTWAEVLERLEKTFPVYETDLSVRTQIEELPMLPEFPSAARVSEYVCGLEYLFSRMNVGSYGATEPHLWLMSRIPQRTWDDCRSTSERKSRTKEGPYQDRPPLCPFRLESPLTCSGSMLAFIKIQGPKPKI